jgi:hypothetical protein
LKVQFLEKRHRANLDCSFGQATLFWKPHPQLETSTLVDYNREPFDI